VSVMQYLVLLYSVIDSDVSQVSSLIVVVSPKGAVVIKPCGKGRERDGSGHNSGGGRGQWGCGWLSTWRQRSCAWRG